MTEHDLILKNQLVLLRLMKVEYLSGCVDRGRREQAEKYLAEELGVDDQIKATREYLAR